jgi:hypothetical protein
MRSTFMRVGLGALIAVAAAAVTSVMSVSPASAQVPIVALAASAGDSDGRWEGGAARDMDSGYPGVWRAYVTNGTETEVWGTYGTEREARKAGKAEARKRNKGFVDAPECEPPILC